MRRLLGPCIHRVKSVKGFSTNGIRHSAIGSSRITAMVGSVNWWCGNYLWR